MAQEEVRAPAGARDFRFAGSANLYAEGHKVAGYDAQACEWNLVIDGIHVGITKLIEKLEETKRALEVLRMSRVEG